MLAHVDIRSPVELKTRLYAFIVARNCIRVGLDKWALNQQQRGWRRREGARLPQPKGRYVELGSVRLPRSVSGCLCFRRRHHLNET